MKLIGKRSLSTILYKTLLIGSVAQVLYLSFLMLGFIISYINLNNGTHYLSQTFKTGHFNYETSPTHAPAVDFQFKIPFSDAVAIGDFTLHTLISILFFLGFYSVFTFYLFKIFKGMSSDTIFNREVIRHLKQFAVLNILFIPFYSLILFFIDQSVYDIDPLFILVHFSTGIVILFIMEFFKKGYELQRQTNLTI